MTFRTLNLDDGNWYLFEGDASQHNREEGKFEVRFVDHNEQFSHLIAAYIRYFNSHEALSIWDITEGEVFLESKTFLKKGEGRLG